MIEALYLHVPFCKAKCRYCDFDSTAGCSDAAFDAYIASMRDCLARLAATGALSACRTAYLGGGTPSILGARLPALVASVRAAAPVLAELTCEANPESFTDGLARDLRAAGATRVSLGVQSFDDTELAALGRLHDAAGARAAVAAALDAGLRCSLDLMCGIPLQKPRSWRHTLDEALRTGVEHVSVYPLALEEGTPLWRAAQSDASLEPDEDFQAQCMEEARARLRAAGFAPYEVASYARPHAACAHNIAYWTGASYLGLGRSAASMLDRATYDALRPVLGLPDVPADAARIRFVQTTDVLPGSDGSAPAFGCECLSAAETVAEDLMLGMRMTRGVSASMLERAGALLGRERVSDAVDRAQAEGLVRWEQADGSAAPGTASVPSVRDATAPSPTARPARTASAVDADELSAASDSAATSSAASVRLVPTDRGWLMGNELFAIFWDLAS